MSINASEYLRTQENIARNQQAYLNIFGTQQSSSSFAHQLPQVTLTTATSINSSLPDGYMKSPDDAVMEESF